MRKLRCGESAEVISDWLEQRPHSECRTLSHLSAIYDICGKSNNERVHTEDGKYGKQVNLTLAPQMDNLMTSQLGNWTVEADTGPRVYPPFSHLNSGNKP